MNSMIIIVFTSKYFIILPQPPFLFHIWEWSLLQLTIYHYNTFSFIYMHNYRGLFRAAKSFRLMKNIK